MSSKDHTQFLKKALNLAKRGEGNTSPNPMVGAVVVKKGEIIGKGYHKKAGLPHAEIEAFNDAVKSGNKLKGATLYVTLEPCCHKDKRTPPCTEAIVEAGIKEVFVGSLDPNPKVSGKGVRYLRKKGVKVTTGILEKECEDLNEFFNTYIVSKKPFVILKMASTMDGKIASKTGDSKWIGSPQQRKIAHELRGKVDGVVVGINTVIKDDPRLNVRLSKKNITQPVPIVIDSKLKIPLKSKLLDIHESSIIITTVENQSKSKKLEKLGASIIRVKPNKKGQIGIKNVLKKLGEMEISSLLVEGGSSLGASFLREKSVNKVCFFIAPKILGGDGLSMIGELGKKSIKNSIDINDINMKRFGSEIMIEGYI